MVGALLGRTAADVAIADTLAGQRVGQVGTAHSYRCQRTQGDDQVDHHEQLGREIASGCAFEFLHRSTNFLLILSLQTTARQRQEYYAQIINKAIFYLIGVRISLTVKNERKVSCFPGVAFSLIRLPALT